MRTTRMTNAAALLLLFGLLVSLETRSEEPSESWIERLIAVHRPVETLRCDIRRERTMAGKTTTRLSRVWYARGNRLRVEGVSPLPTRVLADGTTSKNGSREILNKKVPKVAHLPFCAMRSMIQGVTLRKRL